MVREEEEVGLIPRSPLAARFAVSCIDISRDALSPGSDYSRPSYLSGSNLHRLARDGSALNLENYISSLDLQIIPDHVEEKNKTGSTPLHVATYFGNGEAASVLQRYGANRFYKNKLGWNAGHYAGRWSQPLDERLPVALQPVKPARNSQTFSFKKIRDRMKKGAPPTRSTRSLLDGERAGGDVMGSQSTVTAIPAAANGLRPAKEKLGRSLYSDSGISVFDSEESLLQPQS